jgi:hypothetical protein
MVMGTGGVEGEPGMGARACDAARRGIAMRSDRLARNYRAAIRLAAILIWIETDVIDTPRREG